MGLRPCCKCDGEGPCMWDEKDRRYLCKSCHSNPDDEFFNWKPDEQPAAPVGGVLLTGWCPNCKPNACNCTPDLELVERSEPTRHGRRRIRQLAAIVAEALPIDEEVEKRMREYTNKMLAQQKSRKLIDPRKLPDDWAELTPEEFRALDESFGTSKTIYVVKAILANRLKKLRGE